MAMSIEMLNAAERYTGPSLRQPRITLPNYIASDTKGQNRELRRLSGPAPAFMPNPIGFGFLLRQVEGEASAVRKLLQKSQRPVLDRR